VDTRQFAAIPA